MLRVSETILLPNEPIMEIPPSYNITTPYPPLPETVPTENYPEYELPNDDYTEKLRDVMLPTSAMCCSLILR